MKDGGNIKRKEAKYGVQREPAFYPELASGLISKAIGQILPWFWRYSMIGSRRHVHTVTSKRMGQQQYFHVSKPLNFNP